MNKEQKAKLDKAFKKEKLRKYTIAVAGVSIFLAIGFIYLFSLLPQEIDTTENLTGITVRLTATPTQFGNNTAMVVKLIDGQTIRLAITGGMIYKPNSKVNLKRFTSTSGEQKYQFINYKQ